MPRRRDRPSTDHRRVSLFDPLFPGSRARVSPNTFHPPNAELAAEINAVREAAYQEYMASTTPAQRKRTPWRDDV
jgi:hypothetical protein